MALTEQVKITQHIATSLQEIPRIAQFDAMVNSSTQSIAAYIDTVKALADTVGRLEARIQMWETAYLPHLIDRLPVPHPPTPEVDDSMHGSEESTPKRTKTSQQTIPYNEDIKNAQDVDGEMREEPRDEMQHDEAQSDRVSPLQVLRERSLRSCCARVLEAQGSTVEEGTSKPMALRPFKSGA